jgi:probable rRNA maturation factor
VIRIALTNQQSALPVSARRLRKAVRLVLQREAMRKATISVAIVDDPTIHALNRKYLGHDGPTDVLSFVLDRGETDVEGEVIASADTAIAVAETFGWTPDDELLLYVVHGTLHLVGYDDAVPRAARTMREQEAEILSQFGLVPRYQQESPRDPSERAAAQTGRPRRCGEGASTE